MDCLTACHYVKEADYGQTLDGQARKRHWRQKVDLETATVKATIRAFDPACHFSALADVTILPSLQPDLVCVLYPVAIDPTRSFQKRSQSTRGRQRDLPVELEKSLLTLTEPLSNAESRKPVPSKSAGSNAHEAHARGDKTGS